MISFKNLASGAMYQIISRIVSSGTSFLVTILVARHFGVSAYGDYAKVLGFVTMFYLLADFGFNAIFLQKDEDTWHFYNLFYTRLILAFILFILVNAVSFILPYNNPTNIGYSPFVKLSIFLFSITIFSESIVYSAFAVFQKKYTYDKFMLATIIGSIITILLAGLFVLLKFSLFFVFGAFVIGGMLEACFSIIFSEEKLLPIKINLKLTKELFVQTFPIALMLIFNLIYFRVDILILSFFRNSFNVGVYDISYKVFDFLTALPLFLSNVLYPKILENEKNNQNVKPVMLTYVFRFFVFGAIIAVPFWFLSPVIFFIIKTELLPAVIPLRILLLSLPIFFATSILQWFLLSKKQQKFLSFIYLFLTAFNIIANFLFIPSFGYIASAIITDIGEMIVLILLIWRTIL